MLTFSKSETAAPAPAPAAAAAHWRRFATPARCRAMGRPADQQRAGSSKRHKSRATVAPGGGGDSRHPQQQAPQHEQAPPQPQQQQQGQQGQARSSDDELKRFFRSWAWKREHRPDRDRFHRPYIHTMHLPPPALPLLQQQAGSEVQQQQQQQQQPTGPVTLSIQQCKFSAEGFASSVWDSSIVVAKYVEKWPGLFSGRRCLDMSAGCGLVAVVMAKLGADVVATDLGPNLPLLAANCARNGVDVAVLEHRWGSAPAAPALQQPFDVIVACDVMYVAEAVPHLLASLLALSHAGTTLLIAHGRNRPAEPAFRAAASAHFQIELVSSAELDAEFQCNDVDVLRLRREGAADDSRAVRRQAAGCEAAPPA